MPFSYNQYPIVDPDTFLAGGVTNNGGVQIGANGQAVVGTQPLTLMSLKQDNMLGDAVYKGTAWQPGQFMELGDGSLAHWNGTEWLAGAVPIVITDIDGDAPAKITPSIATPPADLTALKAEPIVGTANYHKPAWLGGEYLVLGDGSFCHWDGNDWVAGRVPVILLDITPGNPSTLVPNNAPPPANLNALKNLKEKN